ncbi:hypothetical protein OSB04_015459 [Centaurea solstitialis]|uniref:TIR domain-containing protein n=1 Tax=Centaurea solstitialis TaxID=347529 RepID=A0AA38SZ33_9ASTR|nr:hypothetical protein OSB04_015459 [Centaurea solstitialis]
MGNILASRRASSVGDDATGYGESTIVASPGADATSSDDSSVIDSSSGDDATCYDVFLSFRGEDTRDSFTDHLYDALGRAGLLTFRDNDEIDRGRELKPEIERAIKASKASIVVLSEHYATSTWCLEELCLILEQRREFNHFVLPVFYHVDPSDVRKQDKTFKIEVKTSSKWTPNNVNRWRTALTKVADLTGFVLSGPETKFLKKIVDTIYNELDCKKVYLSPDLIGMDTRYEEITSWLHQPNLEYLAICGMGGSGKTTLAKYIYNLNWKRFENMSFLEDIGTRCKVSHGLRELQEQLLQDISGGRKRKIPSVSHGTCKIEEALEKKMVLIVLDDILEYSTLVALLGIGKINAKSKIIITTESSYLLSKFSYRCQRYQIKLLDDDESLELFTCHAFASSKEPVEGLKELAAQAVRYCEGNPLAIEVLGSSLSNCDSITYWKSQLEVLRKDIHSRIQYVLERSYNSLPYNSEKELFLHIACFFIGKDMDYVAKILEPDYSAVSGIKTLTNRFLLSISSNNKLMMHRLLQEMGRNIVRQESFKFPEKRSRVWHSNESYKILKIGVGSETVEGLTLDMKILKEENEIFKQSLDLKTDALKKMDNLKYLQLNFVQLTGTHENFSEDLRWLCWFGFHLRTIPSDLFMENLVAIDLSYSNLEVFEPPMEEIYKFAEMSKSSSVEKSVEFTSTILGETIESGSTSETIDETTKLQEQLLKDILGGRKRKVPSVSHGTCKIEETLQKKRALIVLDDIIEDRELVALLGTGKINPESKIIITTENMNLWSKFPSRCRYQMKLLNDAESLELFSCHAFGSKVPVDHLKKLAAQAARYCEGNPLAIEVLGSSLSNCMTIPYWKSQLEVLKKDIHSRIHDVLERSYNSLPYNSEKELFLHIACFFVGKDMDYVAKILEPDYSAVSGIKTLTNRFLLSISSSNKLMMHRLVQEMGRNIVRKESFKLPEKRSRVWHSLDSYKILKKGKGSETIEGLALDMQMLKKEDDTLTSLVLKTDALKKMDKVKYLQLNAAELTGSYENFSEDLRWLCWLRFHLRTIPSDLFMGNLVAIDLSYSNLEVLRSLQILNLKDSHSLLEIRNISMIPHLETLILWNCYSLVRVCETIGDLKSLTLLNMTGCKNLCKREQINLSVGLEASTSGGQFTKQPPFSFPHSLQRLFLKDCHLECTDSFPLNFSVQPSLQYLNLGNSLFEFLPYYDHLKNLRVLDLSLCSRLKWLLCLPSTLAELYVYYCKSLEMITFHSHVFTLQEFGYEGCISLSEIEGFIKLIPIAKLDETDLGHMKWLKKYQNHKVLLVGDDELTTGRSLHLQMLYEFDIMSTSLPDIKDSNTTPEYISESPYLSFDVPSCPKNKRLKGLNVTFKYTLYGDDWAWFAKISTTNGVGLMYNPKVFGNPGFGEVGIWLSYWPIGNKLDVGDKVIVSIVLLSGLVVTECGASLVYADDEEVEETLERNTGCAEALGGDLSGFQLSTGAYYLCRRDFVELMEVGRLAFDWFRVLVGDTIDYTEVRGWRNTGRPKQSNPSFTELKTVRCIIDGPELEEVYKIVEMSKSSLVDKTLEFTSSSLLRETIKSGTTSDICDATTKEKSGSYNLETTAMSKGESEFAETTEFASIPHNEKVKPVVSDENVKQRSRKEHNHPVDH